MLTTRNIVVFLFAMGVCAELAALGIAWLGPRAAGMSWDSIAIEKDGRFYETGRGGGPIEDRHIREITSQQYAVWKQYEMVSLVVAVLGGVLLAVCLVATIAHGLAIRRRAA